jgi:hypothetical protein
LLSFENIAALGSLEINEIQKYGFVKGVVGIKPRLFVCILVELRLTSEDGSQVSGVFLNPFIEGKERANKKVARNPYLFLLMSSLISIF